MSNLQGHEIRQFHIGYIDLTPYRDIVLRVGGKDYPLQRVPDGQFAALAASRPAFALFDPQKITHTVDGVPLPARAVRHIVVLGLRARDGAKVVIARKIHTPQAARLAAVQALVKERGGKSKAFAGLVRFCGLDGAHLETFDAEALAQLDDTITPLDTAAALATLHPHLNILDDGGSVRACVNLNVQAMPATTDFATYLQTSGSDPITRTPATLAGRALLFAKGSDQIQPDNSVISDDPAFRAHWRDSMAAGINGVYTSDFAKGKLYQLTMAGPPKVVAAGEGNVSATLAKTGAVDGLKVTLDPTSFMGGSRTAKVTIENSFPRLVGAYVEYLDAVGNWVSYKDSTILSTTNSQFYGVVSMSSLLAGIVTSKGTLDKPTVDLTLPDNATSLRLIFGSLGLGSGWQNAYAAHAPSSGTGELTFGVISTLLFSIGLQALALVLDIQLIGATTKICEAIEKNPESIQQGAVEMLTELAQSGTLDTVKFILEKLGQLDENVVEAADIFANFGKFLAEIGPVLAVMLLAALAAGAFALIKTVQAARVWIDILEQLVLAFALAEIAEAIPIIGEVFAAVTLLNDVANAAVTVGDILSAQMMSTNQIDVAFAPTIVLHGDDRRGGKFSPSSARYEFHITVESQHTDFRTAGQVTDPSNPIQFTMGGAVPLCGKAMAFATIYDGNGQIVNYGTSGEIDLANLYESRTLNMTLAERIIQISPTTTFSRTKFATIALKEILWIPRDQAHNQLGKTVANTSFRNYDMGNVAYSLHWDAAAASFCFDDGHGAVYAGKLTQSSPYGSAPYPRRAPTAFNLRGENDMNKLLWLLEPKDGPGHYLRKVIPNFTMSNDLLLVDGAFGQFMSDVDAAAWDPAGHLIAVSQTSAKLMVLEPTAIGMDKDKAPNPRYLAGRGPAASGLLDRPVDLAVGTAQVIYVLDQGHQAILAFDIFGCPVAVFGGSAVLPLTPDARGTTWLSLGINGADMLFALGYDSDGADPADYHLDVFDVRQSGKQILNFKGANVARIAVDYFGEIVGLGYESMPASTRGLPPLCYIESCTPSATVSCATAF